MEFEDFASANIFHDTEVVVDPLLFSFWRPWKGNLLRNSLHVHCLETEVILFWKISVITNSERKFAESLNSFYRFHPRVHRIQNQGEGEVIYELTFFVPIWIIRGYSGIQMFPLFVTHRIRDRVYNLVSRRYCHRFYSESYENN